MARTAPKVRRTAREQLMDQQGRAYAKAAAASFKEGKFTATQTGAKRMAEERKNFSDMGEMMKSVEGGTGETEEYIRSGKYKKKGKK